jgi:hypothetical protein
LKYKKNYEHDTIIRNKGAFNEVIRANQYVCPDIWFDSLQYYKELMVKAGGAQRLTPR